MLRKVVRQLNQPGRADGGLGPRGQPRRNRNGVVIGLQRPELVFELRVVAGDNAPQIPGLVALPIDPGAHGPRLRLPAQLLLQCQTALAVDPVARHVERHPVPLLPRLEDRRLLRGNEDDGARAQRRSILPVVPAIELQQYQRPLEPLAIEVGEFALPAVEQRPRYALRWRGWRPHQIRPQCHQRKALAIGQLERCPLIHRHHHLEGLAHHLDPGSAQRALDIVGGRGVARITGHPRSPHRQRLDCAANPLQVGGLRRARAQHPQRRDVPQQAHRVRSRKWSCPPCR